LSVDLVLYLLLFLPLLLVSIFISDMLSNLFSISFSLNQSLEIATFIGDIPFSKKRTKKPITANINIKIIILPAFFMKC
jgi:hypothetical protein